MINTRIIIGLVSTVIAVSVMLWLGINEPARMAETERAQLARSIESGASIFEETCIGCHGKQGEGIPGVAPRLNHQDFFQNRVTEIGYAGTLEDYVRLTIAGGRPVKTDDRWPQNMPTWSEEFGGPLRDDEINDLVNFIMNWESTAPAGEPAPVVVASDDPVAQGEALFQSMGCFGCHALEGVSQAAVGPNLTNVYAEKGPEYIRESIVNPNAVVAEGFPPGVMPQDFGERLSDEDIDGLIEYLKSFSE
ncbi:MAG: c-type cytochrome [Anaerolineae bacterium]